MSSNKNNPARSITRRKLLTSSAGAAVLAFGASVLPVKRAKAANGPQYDLNVEMAPIDTGVPLRTYNGKSSGPVMRVKPGETLSVNITNSLDTNDADDICPQDTHNKFHGSNVTNLHTHGLHVSPNFSKSGADSDNIFLKLLAADQPVVGCDPDILREYKNGWEFDIIDDHPPGTYWYHAHSHGSTAQQVSQGLAGPLIVEDPDGYMPPYIQAARDEGREDIFMIQLRDLDEDYENPRNHGTLALVKCDENGGGEKNPTITLSPGEVRRWRFINAAPRSDAFLNLNFSSFEKNGPELYQIAFDGLAFETRIKVENTAGADPWENHTAMAPGNRTDFMVRVPEDAPEGLFQMIAQRPLQGLMPMDAHAGAGADKPAGEVTLNIRISHDTPRKDAWSESDKVAKPLPILEPIDPDGVVGERNFRFFIDTEADPETFNINGEPFSGEVKQMFTLNTSEVWQIVNQNPFTHPFHIHVNPFFVTHINGRELGENDPLRRWQDTIAIPPANTQGSSVKLGVITALSRFSRYTGKFVIHCHILDHEDQGMMQAVEVIE